SVREDSSKYLMYGDDPNEFISAEILSPILPENDPVWKALINQVVHTVIRADELGISQKNIESKLNSDNPFINDFLNPDNGKNSWEELNLKNVRNPARSIISTVGNYTEIYEKNLGDLFPKNEEGKLKRGPNQLVKHGGVLISPPF
ncbi:MAG: hypothetical protein AAGE59_19835, partial [Cyanobacteria bacterium P01_F01_bin.86]